MKTTAKKVYKTIALLLLIGTSHTNIQAQIVKQAFGVRIAGYPANVGLSYKTYFSPVFSMESVVYTNPGIKRDMLGFESSLLYNYPLGKSRHLFWYAGGGAHVNRLDQTEVIVDRRTTREERIITWQYGLQSKAGIEYKFHHYPINVSVDLGPTMQIKPKLTAGVMGQLAIRYTIPNTRYTAVNYVNRTKLGGHGTN